MRMSGSLNMLLRGNSKKDDLFALQNSPHSRRSVSPPNYRRSRALLVEGLAHLAGTFQRQETRWTATTSAYGGIGGEFGSHSASGAHDRHTTAGENTQDAGMSAALSMNSLGQQSPNGEATQQLTIRDYEDGLGRGQDQQLGRGSRHDSRPIRREELNATLNAPDTDESIRPVAGRQATPAEKDSVPSVNSRRPPLESSADSVGREPIDTIEPLTEGVSTAPNATRMLPGNGSTLHNNKEVLSPLLLDAVSIAVEAEKMGAPEAHEEEPAPARVGSGPQESEGRARRAAEERPAGGAVTCASVRERDGSSSTSPPPPRSPNPRHPATPSPLPSLFHRRHSDAGEKKADELSLSPPPPPPPPPPSRQTSTGLAIDDGSNSSTSPLSSRPFTTGGIEGGVGGGTGAGSEVAGCGVKSSQERDVGDNALTVDAQGFLNLGALQEEELNGVSEGIAFSAQAAVEFCRWDVQVFNGFTLIGKIIISLLFC